MLAARRSVVAAGNSSQSGTDWGAGGIVDGSFFMGAELPRIAYAPAYSLPGGTVRTVASGANLQTTLDAAQPGDVIVLENGATWAGTYSLPNKSGSDNTPIYVMSQRHYDGSGIASGTRQTSSTGMPAIVTNSTTVAGLGTAGSGRTGWRFVDIKFGSSLGSTATNRWVRIGSDTMTDTRPAYFVFDRCVFEGGSNVPTRRALSIAADYTYLVDSSFKEVMNPNGSGDCQCVAYWGESGYGGINNCFLGGATENILFGGYDNVYDQPHDLHIRRSHLTHYAYQNPDDGSWNSTNYALKNQIEWKGGSRCLIEDCAVGLTMSGDNQSPFAIKSTQNAATVSDIVIRYISGTKLAKLATIQREDVFMRRIVLHNIVVTGTRLDPNAVEDPIYSNGPWEDVVLDKITFNSEATSGGKVYITGSGTNLRFTSCIFYSLYGLWTDSGFEAGLLSSQVAGSVTYGGNMFISRNPATAIYVPNSVPTFPTATNDADLYENWATQDLRLKSTSPYKGDGYLGDDPGADVATITTRTSGCISGAW